MKHPNIISVREIIETANQNMTRVPPGMAWVPARAYGYPSFYSRVKAAWLVFTGKADALTWEKGQ
jgi:hypothetical protein